MSSNYEVKLRKTGLKWDLRQLDVPQTKNTQCSMGQQWYIVPVTQALAGVNNYI